MGDYVEEAHSREVQPRRKMWSDYMSECYHSRMPPKIGSVDVKKIEQAAREKLKDRQGAYRFPKRSPRDAQLCCPM